MVGPSGSGKSTLLRCVNLLEEPTAGKVYVGGVEVTDPDVDIDAVRRTIGMVFQQFNLFPHLTVLDNLTIAQRTVLKRGKAESERIANENLETGGPGRPWQLPSRPSSPAGSSSGWRSPARCPWARR